MPALRHKKAACVNIWLDFMCLSPGKLIPTPGLCIFYGHVKYFQKRAGAQIDRGQ